MSERKESDADPSEGPSDDPSDDKATSNASKDTSNDAPKEDVSDESGHDRTTRGGRGWLAGLALVLALGALGLASTPYWLDVEDPEDGSDAAFTASEGRQLEARLTERVGQLETTLDRLAEQRASLGGEAEDRLSALGREVESLSRQFDALRERGGQVDALAERLGRLEGTQSSAEASLEARMAALEQRIEQRVEDLQQRLGSLGDDLERAGRDNARRMALVHARALLIQGRDRLELAGDAETARQVWSRAADVVRRVATTGSVDGVPGAEGAVIEALERLVDAARALPGPATAERVRALDALAQSVDGWPVRQAGASEGSGPVGAGPSSEPQGDGWRDRVASAFGRLVRVESLDSSVPNPVEIDRAGERIEAALAAASVAAASADWATVTVLVERARRDVREHFATEAAAVRDALDRLDALAEPPSPPRAPAAFDEALAAVGEALESLR